MVVMSRQEQRAAERRRRRAQGNVSISKRVTLPEGTTQPKQIAKFVTGWLREWGDGLGYTEEQIEELIRSVKASPIENGQMVLDTVTRHGHGFTITAKLAA